jgi:hypothetical protein
MGDLLDFDGQRRAKRIKVTSSPDLHFNREGPVYSQKQARHPPPPPPTLHGQEQQAPPVSCSDQLQQGQQPLTLPLSEHFLLHPAEHAAAAAASCTGASVSHLSAMDDLPENIPWPNDTVFDPSWKWPASASPWPPPASHHPHLAAPGGSFETGHVFPPIQQPPTPGDFQSPVTAMGTPLGKKYRFSSVSLSSLLRIRPFRPCLHDWKRDHVSQMAS